MLNNQFSKYWLFLPGTILIGLLARHYYAAQESIYNVRYRSLAKLEKGQPVRTFVNLMGKPDTTYVSYLRNGDTTLVYHYNMGPLAPDDIRIYTQNSTIVEFTLAD